MSDFEIKRDFSRYDAMTTEELEQILLADMLITDEDEEYLEMIVYVAQVYAERKKKERAEPITIPAPTFLYDTKPQPEKKQKSVRRFLRRIAAVAAMLVLVICGVVNIHSVEDDTWRVTTRWTNGELIFRSNNAPFADTDIRETIEKLKPTWIPEGFELTTEEVTEYGSVAYFALYERDGRTMSVSLDEATPAMTYSIQKNAGKPEILERNGTTFYFFRNIDREVAAWCADGVICCIAGDISAEEMKKVIFSIHPLWGDTE